MSAALKSSGPTSVAEDLFAGVMSRDSKWSTYWSIILLTVTFDIVCGVSSDYSFDRLLQIHLYNHLISCYLCRYFEEVFLVNDKVPVVGQHVAEIVWDFYLVPGRHNLT